MTSLSRAFAVLELFGPDQMVWSADEIAETLDYSRPTAYRYVRELVETGLLVKLSAGSYSLGPRIVEWDYLMRQADPLLSAGLPAIKSLVAQTGLDINLVALYGDHIVTTHQEQGNGKLPLSFSRGRPFPVLRGAASRIIIAHFPRARLMRLYEAHKAEAKSLGYGKSWDEFRESCAQVRKLGYSLSRGELDAGMAGVAVPVMRDHDSILGCIVAAMPIQRLDLTQIDALVQMLHDVSRTIQAAVAQTQAPKALLEKPRAAGRKSRTRKKR